MRQFVLPTTVDVLQSSSSRLCVLILQHVQNWRSLLLVPPKKSGKAALVYSVEDGWTISPISHESASALDIRYEERKDEALILSLQCLLFVEGRENNQYLVDPSTGKLLSGIAINLLGQSQGDHLCLQELHLTFQEKEAPFTTYTFDAYFLEKDIHLVWRRRNWHLTGNEIPEEHIRAIINLLLSLTPQEQQGRSDLLGGTLKTP